MECFICKSFFTEWKPLLRHFTSIHLMQQKHLFPCKYGSCDQIFYDLYGYGRHFRRHLAQAASVKSTADNNPNSFVNDTSITMSLHKNIHATCDMNNPSSNPDNNIEPIALFSDDICDSSDSLLSNADIIRKISDPTIFMLEMHGKSNFSRKDVNFIMRGIESHIVRPIVKNFTDFINLNCELNSEKRLRFATLIGQELVNPFRDCSSEYRLINLLKEEGYMRNIEQFIVNKEIGEAFRNGEIIYDEVNAYASLLPISFQFRIFFEHENRFPGI